MDGLESAARLLGVVAAADVSALLVFMLAVARRRAEERNRARAAALVAKAVASGGKHPSLTRAESVFLRRRRWIVLREAARLTDSVSPSEAQRRTLAGLLFRCGLHAVLRRDLGARSLYRRARAAVFLPLLSQAVSLPLLVRALERETRESVKLLLADALVRIGDAGAVPTIIDSLKGARPRYLNAVCGVLLNCEGGLDDLIPFLVQRREKEIKLLCIRLASRHCSPMLARHLERLIEEPDIDIARAAFRVLAAARADRLDHARYLNHPDFLIRNLAAESLGRIPSTASLALLFDRMDDPVIRKSACLAVTALIRARPHFLKITVYRCLNEQRPTARAALVEALAGFTDYLMGKLAGDDAELAERMLLEFVRHGKTNEIVNFLNRNADAALETKIIGTLKRLLETEHGLSADFFSYLNRRILADHKITIEKKAEAGPGRRERRHFPLLFTFLFFGAFGVPLAAAGWAFLGGGDATVFLRRFADAFNSIFAVYAWALNSLYLLLFVFSFWGAFRQARFGELPGMRLLFTENVLPSISIISPAYNEEATIVESVKALLNLRYPEYEVIVVNDGSTDGTLERLITAFELERVDVFIHGYLNTREIRGVYAGKRWPDLLVVDKANGGKADSLNAGINVARKDYFSGIDADSLLDRDALLSMATLFLFSEQEVTAAGGNILPANGCIVRGGELLEKRIPARHLARFQSIEYLRAFMAGRVGWAEMNLLLIISGAFGVFHRRSVINAGGYLTQSERFGRDTVGEDMELVVRLSRIGRENNIPFAMQYAHQADCWTEIPERLPIFISQRDRWQRGLIDIICFHAHLLFNPSYGRVGLIGLPYFTLFEVIGPWIELEGLLVFIASLAAGWVSLPFIALVLAATLGLGWILSVSAVLIAERKKEHFPLRDILTLLGYAVIENFGIRQFFNFLRVRGLLRMFSRKTGGWGKMERRGWHRSAERAS